MDRQELLEYLQTTDQYQDSIEYWYDSNLYCFDTFVNDIGSCDYFFTELVNLDTHEPRCYVNLSTKSKYNITIQDVVNFCDTNNSNNDFIEFLKLVQ